jgi:hypothetical protein
MVGEAISDSTVILVSSGSFVIFVVVVVFRNAKDRRQ